MANNKLFSQPGISAEAAQAVLQAAYQEAMAMGTPVAIAVLDREGQDKAFLRMDGAPAISIESCRGKAAAALMGQGSRRLGELLAEDMPALISAANLPGVSLLGGGVPLLYEGKLIGAIGVGGGMQDDDIRIAESGVKALAE